MSIILLLVLEVGYGVLGGLSPAYPCQALPRASVYSVLWGDFGTDPSCLRRLAPEAILVYFSNETCRRPPRHCGRGSFLPDKSVREYNQILLSLPQSFRYRVRRRLAAIERAFKGTPLILSMGLEDNFSGLAARSFSAYLKRTTTHAIDRNPMRKGKPFSADFIEFHFVPESLPEAPLIYSNDGRDICVDNLPRACGGDSISLQTAKQWFSAMHYAAYKFIWVREFNCFRETTGSPYPLGRDCGSVRESLNGLKPKLLNLKESID